MKWTGTAANGNRQIPGEPYWLNELSRLTVLHDTHNFVGVFSLADRVAVRNSEEIVLSEEPDKNFRNLLPTGR